MYSGSGSTRTCRIRSWAFNTPSVALTMSFGTAMRSSRVRSNWRPITEASRSTSWAWLSSRSMRARITACTVSGRCTASMRRANAARPSLTVMMFSSRNVRQTSSMNSGLPVVRSYTTWLRSSGMNATFSAREAMAPVSSTDSGLSTIRLSCAGGTQVRSYSGRHSRTIINGYRSIRPTRCLRTACEVESTQCQSSSTTTSGRRRDPRVKIAASASSNACLRSAPCNCAGNGCWALGTDNRCR